MKRKWLYSEKIRIDEEERLAAIAEAEAAAETIRQERKRRKRNEKLGIKQEPQKEQENPQQVH